MPNTNVGNVTVRFSVQDQEVVRKALEQLGADGQAALKKIDAAGQTPSASLKFLDSIMGDLRGQALGLIAPLGGVGQGFIQLGPAGFVAATAIGVVVAAFSAASEKAAEFAEKSHALKEAAETAGLTITQFKLLSQQGVKVGLDSEQSAQFVNRLTVSIQELRSKGAGPLFDALLKIDAGLVREVASAKDTAEGIDIVARAFRSLDDQFKRNEFVAAISGKRNLGAGQLLEQLGSAGGLKSIEQDAIAAGKAIDENLVRRAAELKLQIDEIKKRTDNIWGRAFAIEILEQQKRSAEFWERIARAIERAATFKDSLPNAPQATAFGRRFRGVDRPFVAGAENDSGLTEEALRRAGIGRASPGEQVPLPQPRPEIAAPVPASVDLALMQRWISLIGAAVTPAEQYKVRLLEIAAAQERGGISTEQVARATSAAALAHNQALVAIRERLGVAGVEEITNVRLAQTYDDLAKAGVKSSEARATAERIVRREAQETADAIKVRGSETPALTKLAIDADKLKQNLDQGLASALHSSTSDLIAMAKGTQTLSQGFANLATKIAEAVLQALLLKNVVGPLTGVAQSAVGSLFGSPIVSARGNIFDQHGVMGFARGGVIDQPLFFPFARGVGLAGEAGPEAIVPLSRGPGGVLGINAFGGASAPSTGNVTVNLINAPAGTQVDNVSQSRDRQGGVRLDVTFKRMILDVVSGDMGDANGALNRILRSMGIDSTRRG